MNFETFKDGDKLPRISGPPLANLIESYFSAKDWLIEELELLIPSSLNYEDSVPNLLKCYKTVLSVSLLEKSVSTRHVELKTTCDAATMTEKGKY